MLKPISTDDPVSVQDEVMSLYLEMFPGGDAAFVSRAFGWAVECFSGRYKDYHEIDASYHDLEHTLQGTLCMARILRGRARSQAVPVLPERTVQLAIAAILLHDTGYLKKRSDLQGTGAKYTVTHVNRSAVFAAMLLGEKGFTHSEILAVQNMIRCTGIDDSVGAISFASQAERIAGHVLASGDLLGQMAAPDYVEKLPILFAEFREAANFSGRDDHFVGSFRSAEDLIERTPAFWENIVLRKINHDFEGVYRFLNDPFPDGPNTYLQQIEANIKRIKKLLPKRSLSSE